MDRKTKDKQISWFTFLHNLIVFLILCLWEWYKVQRGQKDGLRQGGLWIEIKKLTETDTQTASRNPPSYQSSLLRESERRKDTETDWDGYIHRQIYTDLLSFQYPSVRPPRPPRWKSNPEPPEPRQSRHTCLPSHAAALAVCTNGIPIRRDSRDRYSGKALDSDGPNFDLENSCAKVFGATPRKCAIRWCADLEGTELWCGPLIH